MAKTVNLFVAAFLCFAMLCGFVAIVPMGTTTANAASTNELANYNYSFEEAKSGTNVPAHWSMGGGVGNRASLDSTNAFDQTKSLKIDNKTSLSTIGIYSAYVSVQPGDKLTASVSMMGEESSRGFFLRFYANNTDFSTSNHIKGTHTEYVNSTSTTWTTKTLTATVPEGAYFARVLLWVGASEVGVHYYDNVIITKTTGGTPVTPPNTPLRWKRPENTYSP